jgi:hypothetical protein
MGFPCHVDWGEGNPVLDATSVTADVRVMQRLLMARGAQPAVGPEDYGEGFFPNNCDPHYPAVNVFNSIDEAIEIQ